MKRSSFLRMDEQVVYTMAGICIISLAVLAFRYTTDKPCGSVNIGYGPDSIYVNDVVHFTTDTKAAKVFSWNFGDGTVSDQTSSSVNHSYKVARTYSIKVIVDDQCADIQTLVVYGRKPVFTITPMLDLVVPATAYINDKVTFSDPSPGSTLWEWKFEGNAEIISREKSFPYIFKKSGNKKIELTVNKGKKDELTATRFITILPKPMEENLSDRISRDGQPGRKRRLPEISDKPDSDPIGENEEKPVTATEELPKPEPPKPKRGIDISNGQLEALLFEVSEGKKSPGDFADYFCDNTNIPVIYEKKSYSFSEFCSELKRIRKKIKRIIPFQMRNQNNCITSIQVSVKRKGIAGLFD